MSIGMLQAQTTYLHCGRLIDATSSDVKSEMTIVVEGDKITQILSGYAQVPAEAQGVDLKDKTVMPGLIDMHVHIEGESSPKRYEEQFRLNDADVALRSTTYAKKTLMAGFTTVRDMGGTGVNVSLRNAINRGYVEGPRIFTAEKAIGTTGGHADPSNGVRKDLMGDPGPKEGVINSPEDAKKAVRQRYKNGADCIKITATGGVLSVAKDGMGPQFMPDELEAIIAAANDYGFTTAAHAHGAEGMKRAVMAGITTIEHGTLISDEVIELMAEKGTYLVPTISAGKTVVQLAKRRGFFPPIIVPKALEVGAKSQDACARAYKGGVKIAFGTDAAVSPHGDNAKEFIYMVEAGMPPMVTILSATQVAAEALDQLDIIGTIEVGKMADIIATDDNPADNIETMLDVKFVMKNGVVYKN
ncbi:MAG: amidohydrolase family protein [Bacteroidota bacterium]